MLLLVCEICIYSWYVNMQLNNKNSKILTITVIIIITYNNYDNLPALGDPARQEGWTR